MMKDAVERFYLQQVARIERSEIRERPFGFIAAPGFRLAQPRQEQTSIWQPNLPLMTRFSHSAGSFLRCTNDQLMW